MQFELTVGSKKSIKIILVDDEQLILDGLKNFLGNIEYEDYSFKIVGTAETAEELLSKVHEYFFDLLIIDLILPVYNGFEIISKIRSSNINCKILCYSAIDYDPVILKCKQLGANGFVHKNGLPKLLPLSIVNIYNGFDYFQDLSEDLVTAFEDKNFYTGFEQNEIKEILTKRELEVFQKFGDGKTIDEISKKLFITRKTIEYHQKNIKEKLNLNSQTQLICIASHFNLIFRKNV